MNLSVMISWRDSVIIIVRLITKTLIDWKEYLSTIQETTNESPTKILDEKKISNRNTVEYKLTLDSVFDHSYNNGHIYYGFIIVVPKGISLELLQVINNHNITYSIQSVKDPYQDSYHVGIITANLHSWQTFLTNSDLLISCSQEIRTLVDSIILLLEQEGLWRIFQDHKKTYLLDKTFILKK